MGADITCVLERKDSDQWKPVHVRRENRTDLLSDFFDLVRHHALYYILTGYNYQMSEGQLSDLPSPIVRYPRGIPDDASGLVIKESHLWKGSASWISPKEVLDYDWAKFLAQEAPGSWVPEFLKEVQKLDSAENYRFVFWLVW